MVTQVRRCVWVVLFVGVVSVAGSVQGAKVLEIQNGLIVEGGVYVGTESTFIDSNEPDTSYGLNGVCRVGYQNDGVSVFRSLIRFGQLSHWVGVNIDIPAEAILSIKLVMTTDSAFAGDGTCELRIVDSSDQDWTEMYCTWNKKRYLYPSNPDLNWVGGPGLGTNYGSVIDTVSWTAGGPHNTEMEFDLTGAAFDIVYDWLTGDDTSGTFLLKAAR